MRKIAILSLILVSAGALAQSEDATRILEAYNNMRQYDAVNLQVQAARQIGNKTSSSTEQIDWVWDPTSTSNNTAKLSAFDYIDGSEVAHLVGDGTTLFSFDELRSAYIAHEYGAASATNTADYRTDLLQHFDSFSNFRGSYASRLLLDIFGGDSVGFAPWGSGTMNLVDDTTPAQADPINGRTYVPNASQDFVMYEKSGTVSQSIVFQRNNVNVNGTDEWLITQIYVSEEDKTNPSQPRSLQVILTPTLLSSEPPATEFSFVPPVGSKPLLSTVG